MGPKYSNLVNDPAKRKKFIDHVIGFIEKYNFDGLDLDWEYPKCWQVACEKGPASDKANFAHLIKELSYKFKPEGLLLSAAVSPSARVIKDSANESDFVNCIATTSSAPKRRIRSWTTSDRNLIQILSAGHKGVWPFFDSQLLPQVEILKTLLSRARQTASKRRCCPNLQ